ncbi:hypothetical protein ENUP19_0364G0064 [Entamoeba nuttalli]|uniref:Uncharacterized protein n=1 Tax=Entamoeba nuttalli TaxID=412467 RepID=A0ABQ0DYU9_9EUKA
MEMKINSVILNNLRKLEHHNNNKSFPLKLNIIIVYDSNPKDSSLYYDLLQTLMKSIISSYKLPLNYLKTNRTNCIKRIY